MTTSHHVIELGNWKLRLLHLENSLHFASSAPKPRSESRRRPQTVLQSNAGLPLKLPLWESYASMPSTSEMIISEWPIATQGVLQMDNADPTPGLGVTCL